MLSRTSRTALASMLQLYTCFAALIFLSIRQKAAGLFRHSGRFACLNIPNNKQPFVDSSATACLVDSKELRSLVACLVAAVQQ